MNKRKIISILTAARAEYGLLKRLIQRLIDSDQYDVRIAVTGMHLSPEFGFTYEEIEKDGFVIDEKIDILLSADSPAAISKSMGLALIGFSSYFERLQPDILVVLGDRYETLAVCTAALNARILIAHIHGGETTEGAIDEAVRHSISKMSNLHFTSTEEYRRRVIQLGEQPEFVFHVGALGVENIKNMRFAERTELEEVTGYSMEESFAVLTFHPVTLEDNTFLEQFLQIVSALNSYPGLKIIITKANADAGGRAINRLIDETVYEYPEKYKAFFSLGNYYYLSLMKYAEFAIGNSSSGIIEIPSFGIPTIDIGDRQRGRIRPKTVISCEPKEQEITAAIDKALSEDFRVYSKNAENPYGDGNTSVQIENQLNLFLNLEKADVSKKKFYDIAFSLKG